MLNVKIGEHRLSVATGQRLAVIGASGCGKTQLLKSISGLNGNVGSVQFDDRVWQDGGDIFVEPHKRNIAFVFQHRALFGHLDVRGNLLFNNAKPTHFDLVVERLQINALLDRCIEKLSGGEQQRVALARALLQPFDLLILDEPFQGLDKGLKQAAGELITNSDITANKPIIFVSHHHYEVEALATDKHYFLEPSI